MKKKVVSILTVLLLALILTSTASAGGNVGLKKVTFAYGSLDATGTFTGLGGYKEGVTVNLVASGIPVVTCTNQGNNPAPGRNPSRITAGGVQDIPFALISKSGTAPLNISAEPGSISATQGGCPNKNWSAHIDFVFWTDATITVTDNITGSQVFLQNYSCVTTRNPDNTGSVSCTANK